MFPGGWAGHKQNLVGFLWDHPGSIQSQFLPWHCTESMFANVSFVVCVWITKTEKLKLLVVANYHFQGLFYSFKVIKKFHQLFSTVWVGNEQSHTKKTSKHKFLLKSTQEPSTSTSFLTSAQQATSETPQNNPTKAWLQRILVIFNVFFLVLVSKLLSCKGLQRPPNSNLKWSLVEIQHNKLWTFTR